MMHLLLVAATMLLVWGGGAPVTADDTGCPAGWAADNVGAGLCFRMFGKAGYSSCTSTCAQAGAGMVCLPDAAVHTFVADRFGVDDGVALAFRRPAAGQDFAWPCKVGGTQPVYAVWASGEPAGSYERNDQGQFLLCTATRPLNEGHGSNFITIGCDEEFNCVCQQSAAPATAVPTVTTTAASTTSATTAAPTMAPTMAGTKASRGGGGSSKDHSTVVILACVGGGLLLLGAVGSIMFVKHKQHLAGGGASSGASVRYGRDARFAGAINEDDDEDLLIFQ